MDKTPEEIFEQALEQRKNARAFHTMHWLSAAQYMQWMTKGEPFDFKSDKLHYYYGVQVLSKNHSSLSSEQLRFLVDFFKDFEALPVFNQRSNPALLHHQEYDGLNDFVWFAAHSGYERLMITKEMEAEANKAYQLLTAIDDNFYVRSLIGNGNFSRQIDLVSEGSLYVAACAVLDPKNLSRKDLEAHHTRFKTVNQDIIENLEQFTAPEELEKKDLYREYHDMEKYLKAHPWHSQRLLYLEMWEGLREAMEEHLKKEEPLMRRALGIPPEDGTEELEKEEGWKSGEPDGWEPPEIL